MLGIEKTTKLIEKEVIEVAPLAYLRGRTLNNSFIIMDESQNTTVEQMKMVLTRIGFGSQAVINGDLTQIDLPKHITSGLDHVIHVLKENYRSQGLYGVRRGLCKPPMGPRRKFRVFFYPKYSEILIVAFLANH